MAKEDIDLGKVSSWEDALDPNAPKEKRKSNTSKKWDRRTFLLSPELSLRVNELAEHYNVELNELVRYLFSEILEQVESGKHKLPVKTRTVAQIDWESRKK